MSGTLHLFSIFKVRRRPNGHVANGSAEPFGCELMAERLVAGLFKMLTQESELNPPKYCGG
jgi:hypothetical protein